MEKCRIKALSEGYSADLPLNSKASTISGVVRVLPTIGAPSANVNVTWKVNKCSYNYLMMFYLLYKNLAFTIDLITYSGVVETKTCKFVPETFKVSLDFNMWTVTATLEVVT